MVNTERIRFKTTNPQHYNILNIVVNTEPPVFGGRYWSNYNILNIVVNTELYYVGSFDTDIITY